MKRILFLLLTLGNAFGVFGQNTQSFDLDLKWSDQPLIFSPTENRSIEILAFEEAGYDEKHPTLPILVKHFPLNEYGTLSVRLENAVYESLVKKPSNDDIYIKENVGLDGVVQIERGKYFGRVVLLPIRKNNLTGGYEKLVSGRLVAELSPQRLTRKNKRNGITSVLNDGKIYKIATTNTGIHKLEYDFLKDLIPDIDNIDPRNIQLFGNGGGMLPHSNAESRAEDLLENPIVIVGEGDGSFDSGDYILFYGESADAWSYRAESGHFRMAKNVYDEKNHYFLKIGTDQGKRIADRSSLTNTNYTATTFNDFAHHEVESLNLLDLSVYAHASGRTWYGESFKFTTSRDFDFNFPNLITSQPASIRTSMAARTLGTASTFSVKVNNSNIFTESFGSVNSNLEADFAVARTRESAFNANNDNLKVTLDFSKGNSDAEGWLNYIELNVKRQLTLIGKQMSFRDISTIGQGTTNFVLGGVNSNITVWDITNVNEVTNQLYTLNGNQLNFGVVTDDLKEFIAFDGTEFFEAEAVGEIPNQNLHSLAPAELIILYHEKFKDQAERLADHRRSFSNMTVALADIREVYNEFSSGNADITAVRDFAKYIYDQGSVFKYLLLFGDGSFDQRNIRNDPENHNYIPVYETSNSVSPIGSYPADDYYGLLDVNEGGSVSAADSRLDIAIGRFPVRYEAEAIDAVNKIIRYDTDPATLGDWKNRLTFVTDDEDNNLHIGDGDAIANKTWSSYPNFNPEKIYLDAYQQVSTQGGNRFPDAETAIGSNIFKGNLTVNYTGHGDDSGWAQERVLKITDIDNWQNPNRLPLVVTATCSFGPYDAPHKVSAGELLFLTPRGGAIGLYTTTRLVFASSNRVLTNATFESIFEPLNGEIQTIGETLRLAKNESGAGVSNSRKFTLLGDPSMRLALPKYKVMTSTVNGNPVPHVDSIANNLDTLKALQKVTITGYIGDLNGEKMTDFNGTLYPTVYDKRRVVTTLSNDAGSPERNFTVQTNIIFKGRVSVVNGDYTFSFIIPKDINYEYGIGKISYYAEAGIGREASGNYRGIVIGGTDQNALTDDEGPVVKVFMNDENFVFGGITDEAPILLAKLTDDLGINTTGTGIGHDITAILDENTSNTMVLNDFYEAELDDFTKGQVLFPLTDIKPGIHSITVKAWDISNNSGTGYTEFLVSESAEMALSQVLNYPNPFTTNTEFMFEHNFPNQPLAIQVQIFTVNGDLLKTIQADRVSEGYRVAGIEWDGTDDFGNSIGRGVYVYKISAGLLSSEGEVTTSESEFQKLVILK